MKCHRKDLNPGPIMFLLLSPASNAGTNRDHLVEKDFLGRKVEELELLSLEQRVLKDGSFMAGT